MWNVPHYRIRAYIQGLKKSRKTADAIGTSASLHLKRTQANLLVLDSYNSRGTRVSKEPEKVIPGMIVLNDFLPRSVSIFSEVQFAEGTHLGISLEHPLGFYVSGRVRSCRLMHLQRRTIAKRFFAYRVEVEFEFHSRAEADTVRRYCDEVIGQFLQAA